MRAGRGGLGLLASWFGHRRGAGLAVVALLLAWGLAGCEAQVPAGPRVRAENVWSRPALAMAHGQDEAHGMGTTGVVYLTLANEGREADRLIAAKSNVAASVELHQTTMEGGVMKMQPVRSVTVPVGGKVELKPGGVHLMLINLKRNLTAGDRFEVMLTFEKSGSMTVASEVRQP